MDGFDWDDENLKHVARHDVTVAEVEEVFRRPYIEETDGAVNGEDRFRAYGVSARWSFVNHRLTERNRKIRPITAWNMSRTETKKYAKQILEG